MRADRKARIEFVFLQTFPFFSFSSFSQESKSSGGSIIVASRLSPSIFYHVPSAKLNHLKIHYALSRGEREKETERERRERERRAGRFGRRATTCEWRVTRTFVRELMILIHQPTFRFEEDEGYATRVLLINRSTPPRGGIASSNRPNSDEFLATDFAPLTHFFRPRKVEKIVAVEAAVAIFPLTFHLLPPSLPRFLPFYERYPETREEI